MVDASLTKPAKFCVVGILVAYDRDLSPMARVESAQSYLNHIVLVDNTPSGHPYLRDVSSSSRLTVIANGNEGGLAGAYNAAIDWIGGNCSNTTHVLFLDEDTDLTAIEPFLRSEITREYFDKPNVAAVAPVYVERETGLPGAHIQLSRLTFRVLPRDLISPAEVAFLINSMSLWRMTALRHIGPYNADLKVDHIDTDYCLRAKQMGYKLILNPSVRFPHSIGKRRQYRLFGQTLQSGGHSPERREMIGRNTVLLAKHFGWRYPSFLFLCLARLAYEVLGILMAESERPGKVVALLRGGVLGLFRNYRVG